MAKKRNLKPKVGSGLTFYGSHCSKDCSGHLAGWLWRQNHPGARVHANKSFTAGANIRSTQSAAGKNPIGAMARNTQTGQYTKIRKKR